jgi:transcriptional regulator with XRE-family HTH domain
VARPNALRSIEGESNLAQRVRSERERRGWSYEKLAKLLSDSGCSINGSSIYRIEKGAPPRKITVDELIAFARVFEKTVQDLLTPVELVRKERGKQIVAGIEQAGDDLAKAVVRLSDGYVEYFDLCAYDPELREFVDNRRGWRGWADEAAEDFVPSRLFTAHLGDGKEVEVDDSRLRSAIVEVHLALIEVAGELAMQAVDATKGRENKL